MHTLTRYLSAGLLLMTWAHAQEPASAPESVSLQFGLYAWKGELPKLSYGPHHTVEAVEAFTRSSIQNYTGPVVLNFTLAAQSESTDPKAKQPPVVASVTLPKGVSKITLLTARTRQGHFQIYAIPEDGDAFPAGSVRLHNVTAQPLLIVYNENDRVELAPAATAIVKPLGTALLVRAARKVNGQWRELFNNVATLGPDGRQNVLFTPGDDGSTGVGMYILPPWSSPPKSSRPL